MSDPDQNKQRNQDEISTQSRANLLGVRYLDSRLIKDFKPVEGFLDIAEMHEMHMLPLAAGEGKADFAITINTSQQIIKTIRNRFSDHHIKFMMISDAGFDELMLIYDPPEEVVYDDISIKSEGDSENIGSISEKLEEVHSDDMLHYLVTQASKLNASDIHLEAEKDHIRMRFRIDGALHAIAQISEDKYRQLQSAIAIKADIASQAPDAQTGHLNVDIEKEDGSAKTINMRIETVPTMFGQDAVLRIFNMDRELLDLDKIGLSKMQRDNIDQIISHPHGMVLVVGPTGSGKTTTLYSTISRLNQPTRKIITLEDPVEYAFAGVSQIQVNSRSGESFDETLRAVLRQDPDVIMLGEIRDADTAKTALQAALTGHLVLTTFHADSAAAALTRLFDSVGGNPLFSSAIKLVIAQRLVRKLDPKTRQAYTPDERLKKYITGVLKGLPESVELPDLNNIQLYKAGKSEENPFGYKGRIMIMEQLKLSLKIEDLIQSDRHSQEDIESIARQEGMVTMLQDGMLKVLRGETTIEEIYRVVD